ncbi:MAG: hypothetical protein DI596_08745, partial [Azospira oryzae]
MGASHAQKVERLRALLAGRQGPVGLAKSTSNLFRDRREEPKQRLDVREFDTVLQVDPAAGLIDAEGMVTYERLADMALACGVMPAVVPQLKSITLGGAVAGVAIESSAFRYGLVHETVEELEVLTGDGRVVVARRDNEHRELFYGFPNSYGTLGYALRLKVKAVPVKRYVRLEHRRFSGADAFFGELGALCHSDLDFIDGTVFARDEMYLTVGRFVDQAPYTSDYSFEHIYYRSIRSRSEDYLAVRDYLWRWDTDWFWCSKNVGAQNPLLRRFAFGRSRLDGSRRGGPGRGGHRRRHARAGARRLAPRAHRHAEDRRFDLADGRAHRRRVAQGLSRDGRPQEPDHRPALAAGRARRLLLRFRLGLGAGR